MTDPVRAKIVELVPGIVDRTCRRCANWGCKDHIGSGADRSITLADVLRAIYIMWSTVPEVAWQDMFTELLCSRVNCWNLTTDYDNQTAEVKAFVGSLLGVTNNL